MSTGDDALEEDAMRRVYTPDQEPSQGAPVVLREEQLVRCGRFVRSLVGLMVDVEPSQVMVTQEEVDETQGVVHLFWVHLPSRSHRGQLIGQGGRVARDLRGLFRVWARGAGLPADHLDMNIHRG